MGIRHTLNTKTPVEVIRMVKEQLLAQGRKSLRITDDLTGATGCAYRGADGCKCAVGFLLSDEDYKPEMEGTSVSRLDLGLTPEQERLLQWLQKIHDGCEPQEWPQQFEILEAAYVVQD